MVRIMQAALLHIDTDTLSLGKQTPDQVEYAIGQVFVVFTYSTDKCALRRAS